MSNRPLLALIGLFSCLSILRSAPVVVGVSRFHSDVPSANGGRVLFNELGCGNCHSVETQLPTRRGPEIRGITTRLQAEWLRKFLAAPDEAHPGINMPAMLSQDPQEIEAIIHYLGSLKPKTPPKTRPPAHVNSSRGETLFHTIGCVACHQARDSYIPEEGTPQASEHKYPPVSFPQIADKYTLQSLTEFLADPLKMRTDGRMPRIDLEETEASDIAGYLLGFEGSDGKTAAALKPFSVDATQAKRGQTLVAEARCAACHDLPKEVVATTVSLAHDRGGCLDDSRSSRGPKYSLSANQRASLSLFLSTKQERVSQAEKTTLTLQALNCYACHERDGAGGPDAAQKAYFTGDHNLGDTGRYPPPLTSIGRKLQPEWLAKVLLGENRVRPYLKTRMPIYGSATESLAKLLEEADQREDKPLRGGEDTAGRKLLGTLGGIGCITCHRWGERASLGIQALDLSNLGQRLRPEWLREYLIDPAAYRPDTLMPSFWPGGKASNPIILDGDTERQIASIYSFAKSANGEPEGFPEIEGGQFELIPKERPIIQRTFLKDVGTHAILVGFPTGVHLAFNAKSVQPAMLWKGRFFDAYTTWFSRFAPFEKPLSENVARWAHSESSGAELRFEGYKLDKSGCPSFLYTTSSGTQVEDRFEGIENGLSRQVSWREGATEPFITHPQEVLVKEEPTNKTGERRFTYFWK